MKNLYDVLIPLQYAIINYRTVILCCPNIFNRVQLRSTVMFDGCLMRQLFFMRYVCSFIRCFIQIYTFSSSFDLSEIFVIAYLPID